MPLPWQIPHDLHLSAGHQQGPAGVARLRVPLPGKGGQGAERGGEPVGAPAGPPGCHGLVVGQRVEEFGDTRVTGAQHRFEVLRQPGPYVRGRQPVGVGGPVVRSAGASGSRGGGDRGVRRCRGGWRRRGVLRRVVEPSQDGAQGGTGGGPRGAGSVRPGRVALLGGGLPLGLQRGERRSCAAVGVVQPQCPFVARPGPVGRLVEVAERVAQEAPGHRGLAGAPGACPVPAGPRAAGAARVENRSRPARAPGTSSRALPPTSAPVPNRPHRTPESAGLIGRTAARASGGENAVGATTVPMGGRPRANGRRGAPGRIGHAAGPAGRSHRARPPNTPDLGPVSKVPPAGRRLARPPGGRRYFRNTPYPRYVSSSRSQTSLIVG